MNPAATLSLILDQGVPRDAARKLREVGVDCVHVGELGMSQAEDREILQLALQRQAAVVTLDADFHTALAVTRATAPSAIRFRLQGLNAHDLAALTVKLLDRFSDQLRRGCLLTVKAKKTTCHMLPVAGPECQTRPGHE